VGLNILNRIGKVIDHNIDKFIELVLETRKDFNQKALLYNSSGEDSPPVKNDRIILLHIDGTGKYIAAGVLTESQGAKPGEKIFFARDQKGNIVLKVKMLNNGDYIFDNNTETTAEATGNYSKEIKGDSETIIHKNRIIGIEENDSLEVAGNNTKNIMGDANWSIGGNLDIDVTGAINIKAGSSIKINGVTIYLN
jgi:hypothetical protein